MQNNISLITESVRSASKFLRRDYFELENLQSSKKNTKFFVAKAKNRVIENLQKSLSHHYKVIVIDNEISLKDLIFSDYAVLVKILDGEKNFERAIPFFAIVLTIITKKIDNLT